MSHERNIAATTYMEGVEGTRFRSEHGNPGLSYSGMDVRNAFKAGLDARPILGGTDHRAILKAMAQDRSTEAGRAASRMLRRLDGDTSSSFTERHDWIAILEARSVEGLTSGEGVIPADWVNSIKGVKPTDQFIALDRRAFEDCIARALAASLATHAGDWQPIESAPKDGSWFIADGGGLDRPTPMKWNDRVGAWECDAVMLEDWDAQAEGYSRPLYWSAIPSRGATHAGSVRAER